MGLANSLSLSKDDYRLLYTRPKPKNVWTVGAVKGGCGSPHISGGLKLKQYYYTHMGRKFSLEFEFRYFANGRFAKFKSAYL